jgi:Protein of unknown function (DUF3592)
MTWAEATLERLKFFTVGLVFLCPGFLIWMAPNAKRQYDSNSWPEVPGIVVATLPKPWVDSDKVTMYFGRVVYRYSVDGKEYTTDLTDLGPGAKRSTHQQALADVSSYRAGKEVRVFYDPADPSIGILEPGIPSVHQGLIVGLLVGSLIGIVGSIFIVPAWVRAFQAWWRPAAADPITQTDAKA